MTLTQLKREVLADGVIDEEEVKRIREFIFADGKIDLEEANWLFEMNDAVSGGKAVQAWTDLMVDAICAHLLDDPESPGEVSDEEALWLMDKIQGDNRVDDTEQAIVRALYEKAARISPLLKIQG